MPIQDEFDVEEIQRDGDLIVDIKISANGVRLRKIDKRGKQLETLVSWEENSNCIKEIFNDFWRYL